LPCACGFSATPGGHASSDFFASSPTHTGPESRGDEDEEDDAPDEEEDDDEGVEGVPAACALRAPTTTNAKTTTHKERTRFILYLPHFDVIVWR